MLPGRLQMLGWGTIGSPSKVWDVVHPVGAVVLEKLRWVCTLVQPPQPVLLLVRATLRVCWPRVL